MKNKWDVWLATVKFEDKPDIVKKRPVIVLSDEEAFVISLKVTSNVSRESYFGNYKLKEWQQAGLDKPSVVIISKRLKLVESDFIHRIGKLRPIDIYVIQKIIENKMY